MSHSASTTGTGGQNANLHSDRQGGTSSRLKRKRDSPLPPYTEAIKLSATLKEKVPRYDPGRPPNYYQRWKGSQMINCCAAHRDTWRANRRGLRPTVIFKPDTIRHQAADVQLFKSLVAKQDPLYRLASLVTDIDPEDPPSAHEIALEIEPIRKFFNLTRLLPNWQWPRLNFYLTSWEHGAVEALSKSNKLPDWIIAQREELGRMLTDWDEYFTASVNSVRNLSSRYNDAKIGIVWPPPSSEGIQYGGKYVELKSGDFFGTEDDRDKYNERAPGMPRLYNDVDFDIFAPRPQRREDARRPARYPEEEVEVLEQSDSSADDSDDSGGTWYDDDTDDESDASGPPTPVRSSAPLVEAGHIDGVTILRRGDQPARLDHAQTRAALLERIRQLEQDAEAQSTNPQAHEVIGEQNPLEHVSVRARVTEIEAQGVRRNPEQAAQEARSRGLANERAVAPAPVVAETQRRPVVHETRLQDALQVLRDWNTSYSATGQQADQPSTERRRTRPPPILTSQSPQADRVPPPDSPRPTRARREQVATIAEQLMQPSRWSSGPVQSPDRVSRQIRERLSRNRSAASVSSYRETEVEEPMSPLPVPSPSGTETTSFSPLSSPSHSLAPPQSPADGSMDMTSRLVVQGPSDQELTRRLTEVRAIYDRHRGLGRSENSDRINHEMAGAIIAMAERMGYARDLSDDRDHELDDEEEVDMDLSD
ncbi:MAG: hypothetical protein M1828_001507 [Chrysothrix sp. TS-e1954]|nr:MAG: hypothetical protein M1828_001507 [Chrysothrix sp. TS-e1954]